MKKLNDILQGVDILKTIGNTNIDIKNICIDSRNIKNGDMFFARKGVTLDGHKYIKNAIEKGAVAIILEDENYVINSDKHTFLLVDDTNTALAIIAENFFDKPSSKLKLVGVTGTNGKTTTATLLYQLMRSFGKKAGLISTIANYINGKKLETTHTTPDAITISSLIKEMADASCEYCFMEVSSHAIDQKRVEALDFDIMIFTNITQDHLDYHKTFLNYLNTKKKIFDKLKSSAISLVNADDKHAADMVKNTKSEVLFYALKKDADFKGRIIEQQLDSIAIEINKTPVWVMIPGTFNAYNILAVYATAISLGFDKDLVLEKMSTLKGVEGRFDVVKINDIYAIVDYAHTPDAVKNILESIRKVKPANSKIITVIGAGGDRDKTKRPKMARIAVEKSDKVILTSDNPRSEDPVAIIEDMKKGVDENKKAGVITIVDRAEAIRTACLLAQKGDIVLVAGKGHEKYQDIKGVKHDFDDKKILSQTLNLLTN